LTQFKETVTSAPFCALFAAGSGAPLPQPRAGWQLAPAALGVSAALGVLMVSVELRIREIPRN